MTAFTGLSAFPLTPIVGGRVDENAFVSITERLASAGVDSITALGSTGCAAYLDIDERTRVARLAVQSAGAVPVHVGVSALRTVDVLENIAQAENAGAAGVLLAPMTYQPLTDDEVFELFRIADESTTLPLIVYDNPGTTHFTFSTELYGRIAELPRVASIKIPGVPRDPDAARRHIEMIRSAIPAHVTIGVSGDAFGAAGLIAGCDGWYSAIAGTVPEAALRIVRALKDRRAKDAEAESRRLEPLWNLFIEHRGSLRVIAALAEHLGLVDSDPLPRPILSLTDVEKARVVAVFEALGLEHPAA